MINFSLKNEIVDSTEDVINRRASTPIYGTFLISWVIFHWEFLYTSILVSEEKIFLATGLLRNEYLVLRFFDFADWYFYVSWLMPIVMTYLLIWVLPMRLFLPAFVVEEKYRIAKLTKRAELEGGLLALRIELAKQEDVELGLEEKKAERRQKIVKTDPTILWKKEFADFLKTEYAKSFHWITESIYSHGGEIKWYSHPNTAYKSAIPQNLLAYADSHGLITVQESKISLTEKGKFFVAGLTEKNPQ